MASKRKARSHTDIFSPSERKRTLSRLCIAIILVLSVFLFIHFREEKIEALELGALARGYVVAQVDFDFPDPDHSTIAEHEAMRDVGKIYKISSIEIQKARKEYEDYLIEHPEWRNKTNATFEQMYNGLAAFATTLQQAILTDQRTIKKRKELHLSTEHFYPLDIAVNRTGQVLPPSFWQQISNTLIAQRDYDKGVILSIAAHFRNREWRLILDAETQRLFQRKIAEELGEQMTPVHAGSRIIDKGERITPRHISMMKAMKKALRDSRNLFQPRTIFGSLLLSTFLVFLGAFYFYIRQRPVYDSLRRLALYTCIIVIVLIVTKSLEWVLVEHPNPLFDVIRFPISVPFASILICVLLNEEIALFTTFYLTVIMGGSLAVDRESFMMINMVTGITGSLVSLNLRKRKEIFSICIKVWLSAAAVIFCLNLYSGTILTTLPLVDFAISALDLMIMAILLIGIMPLLESTFNVMTDMSLMEYLDPTSELLQRLSIEAPGTYQHSHAIGHLAEYAANAIGARGLFCRVTTMYHDIGKLNTPHYYTENQMGMKQKFNIHELLTPTESAYIIKSHIPDGVALAKQYRLPQPFIDVIRQHHGTTLIKYFYHKQIEEMGGHVEDVDMNVFRYPGPKPHSKEAAIIMIADSAEAASRTLEDNSEEAIRAQVDAIVKDKFNDGQFEDCPLTCHELHVVQEKLVEMIKATYHMRVKYPKDKEEKEETPPAEK